MKISSLTDTGLVRSHNEDSVYATRISRWDSDICHQAIEYYLAVVADGMGGAAAGDLASSLAVKNIIRFLTGELLGIREGAPPLPENIPGKMADAVQEANDVIYTRALEEPDLTGMGTTAVILLTFNGTAYWASVGDSRLYLFRSGELQQITQDHSYVADLVRQGKITSAQARTHPNRNLITRSVGADDLLNVDTGSFALVSDDILLLCTDGLNGMVSDHDIASVLKKNDLTEDGVRETAATLVRLALEAGGKDNVSVVILETEVCDTKKNPSLGSLENTVRMQVPPNLLFTG